MKKSPMEINPTLSPMDIGFDREPGIIASSSIKMVATDASEKHISSAEDYPLDPPTDDAVLVDTLCIEDAAKEPIEEKIKVLSADKKASTAKKKSIKPTSTKAKSQTKAQDSKN